MRNLLPILLAFLINLANAQDEFNVQISKIDHLSKQGKYKTESFSGYEESCETIWYFEDSRLVKIHEGCGDVSKHMFSVDYFFIDSFVIKRNIDVYCNAPPTYTEENALTEGVTDGWFDPNKTLTDTLIHCMKDGILYYSTKNDSIITLENEEKRKTVYRIKEEVNFLRFKQCRYIYDKDTGEEIYTNAGKKLDSKEFVKRIM